MANSARATRTASNLFQDWVTAMSNQYGEMDVRMENITFKLPFIPEPVEVNGSVTVSFHLRELSPKEKDARVAKEVRLLRP